jgi:hypothetical protein
VGITHVELDSGFSGFPVFLCSNEIGLLYSALESVGVGGRAVFG